MLAVEVLKAGIKENKALEAICFMFALRERSRSTIKVPSLMQKMRREGFMFSREDYDRAVKVLVQAGVGQPILNRRGRLVGLGNIKMSLQDIGKAVYGDKLPEAMVKTAVQRVKPPQLTLVKKVEESQGVSEEKAVEGHGKPLHASEIGLLVSINGKPVTVKFFKDAQISDITDFITKITAK